MLVSYRCSKVFGWHLVSSFFFQEKHWIKWNPQTRYSSTLPEKRDRISLRNVIYNLPWWARDKL